MMASKPRKRKRVILTIEDKLEICELVHKGRTMTSVSEEYEIGRPTVHDIVKSEDKLKTFQTELEDNDCGKKRRAIRRSDLPELDKATYLWFVQQRCQVHCVSHGKACEALETVLQYLEEQPEVSVSTMVLLNGLLMKTTTRRAKSLIQTKISGYFKS